MITLKSSGQTSLDNQSSPEHEEAVRKSAERSELREALLKKLARPTRLSKMESKKSMDEQILEELQKISAKLGDPAEDNTRYLIARSMGVDPGRGKVPMAPKQDHQNAADGPSPLIAEWLKGRIL